jgi:hydroxypyruvate isomerase
MKAGAVSLASLGVGVPSAALAAQVGRIVKNGRINQSACRWCYGDLSLEELCAAAAKMGLNSVELLGPAELPTVKKHGLVCAMVNSHGIGKGLNNKGNHTACLAKIRESIDAAAEHGCPNVIAFSGNRAGMPDDVGLENAAVGLKQVVADTPKRRKSPSASSFSTARSITRVICSTIPTGASSFASASAPSDSKSSTTFIMPKLWKAM